eukprot:scaffold77534_cov22-Tisochrysis_lutea.AAC.3
MGKEGAPSPDTERRLLALPKDLTHERMKKYKVKRWHACIPPPPLIFPAGAIASSDGRRGEKVTETNIVWHPSEAEQVWALECAPSHTVSFIDTGK